MYLVSLVYVSKLTQIIFKRDSHQVISVSCYPEALVEAFLCLQFFVFVVSGSNTCMYSKGVLRVRAVTLSAPNCMTWGGEEVFLASINLNRRALPQRVVE